MEGRSTTDGSVDGDGFEIGALLLLGLLPWGGSSGSEAQQAGDEKSFGHCVPEREMKQESV